MLKKILLGCGLPLLLLVVLGVYFGRNLLKPETKTERSETVTRGDVEIKVVETGTIEPLKKVEVKSKAGGRVLKLIVDEGQTVQAGQTIALIDPQEVNSQVDALRAELSAAQARQASAEKGVTYQQSQTTTGVAQYQENVASAQARVHQLEAEAEAQPHLTNQSIAIAQANLEAAQENQKALQDSLDLMVKSTHPQAIVTVQSSYDQAKAQEANSRRTLERQKQLLTKGFVSQSVVDSAETDVSVAAAHTREVKERLDRIQQTNTLEEANLRSQIRSAAGQARQMQAALDQAKTSVLPETKRRELESARAALKQAKAQLASAQSGTMQDAMRKDDVAAAKAQVRQIENQLKEVLVRQKDTTLFAAMTGVVTKRYVEEGEIITSAISSFSAGTPVYQISDLGVMLVKININEVDIAKIHNGLPVEVTIDAAKGVTFAGRVRKVSPAAQNAGTTGQSGGSGGGGGQQNVVRFLVEVQIDHADPRLKPGMSARCAVIGSRKKDALRIPLNCVYGTGTQTTAQIVTTTMKEGKPVETTTPRPITIGLRGDEFVEVLSGLKEGEKVRPAPYTGPARKTIEMRGGPD